MSNTPREELIDRHKIAKRLRDVAESIERYADYSEVRVKLVSEFDCVPLRETYAVDGYLALYIETPKHT